MKTRSATSVASPALEDAETPSESVSTSSMTFILPRTRSSSSRFVALPNPSSGSINRYFFCPETGIYEFTSVATVPFHPRSILFTGAPKPQNNKAPSRIYGTSTLSKKAELLIATPVDMIFFLLPILIPETPSSRQLFQPLDDLVDSQEDILPNLRFVLYNESIRNMLQGRTEAICDVVEAGDEKMFRLNEMKLVEELLKKARRISSSKKLPPSLEERFVRQALEPPPQFIMRDVVTGNNFTDSANTHDQNVKTETVDSAESQSSVTTVNSASISTSSTTSTPVTQLSLEEVIMSHVPSSEPSISELLRIRVAMTFIQESYLPRRISTRVDEILASPESPINFKPLDDQLKHLNILRAEAVAARSASDYTRKRTTLDGETDIREGHAEKKRRLEEEEKKKKAGQSRAVRELKKVDTTGMKKMSDFFRKRVSTKKG